MFLLALQQSVGTDVAASEATDLLLVALMELAPRDAEIRSLAFEILTTAQPPHTPQSLGQRLLDRAHEPTSDRSTKETA